jgi:hypothetical protein
MTKSGTTCGLCLRCSAPATIIFYNGEPGEMAWLCSACADKEREQSLHDWQQRLASFRAEKDGDK